MKNTVRINFDFPRKHYPYLKMLCAKKGISMKEFATKLLIKELEEYEDRLFAEKAQKTKSLTIKDKKRIIEILKQGEVKRASLFGSYARGEATSKSDIDILVEFGKGKNLLDLVGLKIELEESLGRPVDLLTFRSIHPPLKDRILSEQVPLI